MQCRILHGDCRKVLRDLPDESVHCVVTSPPYWGLRSYGGDAGMIGLEPTFDEHLGNLVAVFREVRRVLRDDGTLWLNYGDAYAGAGRTSGAGEIQDKHRARSVSSSLPPVDQSSFKSKDLMMMPARVAMALQADGWWLRSEIIWHKPNPMPESCTDRPTSSHEKLFLLTKSARYFYDADAVRVPHLPVSLKRIESGLHHTHPADQGVGIPPVDTERMGERFAHAGGRNSRNVWTIPTHSFKEAHFATFPPKLVEPCIKAGTSERGVCGECGAPWERKTEKGAPLKDQMAACGADSTGGYSGQSTKDYASGGAQDASATKRRILEGMRERNTTGWAPTCCDCHVSIMTPVPDGDVRSDPTMQTGRKGLNRERNTNATRAMTRGEQRDYARQIRESENREQIRDLAGDGFDHYVRTDQSGARPLPPDVLAQCIERGWLKPASAQCDCACKDAGDPVPATVLDPFAGSGTVGQVALSHGRSFIGVEINQEYVEIGKRRTDTVAPLFTNARGTR